MKRCLNCMKEYPDSYEDRCPHCGYLDGATQNGERNLSAGTILQGRYIVGTVIRVRDVDVIYHGWDALFDRRVQIQEYFPKYCATRAAQTELSIYQSKEELFQQGLELFVSQSRELIRLYQEPDVVTYHACFRENKTAYAVMDFQDYKTLKEWAAERRISGRDGVDLLLRAIEAVEKCQELGLYHGMIDADSFWVCGGGLVLKDFGPWKYVSGEPGVVGYGDPGPAIDVYGLAKMFCQLVTGNETDDSEKLEQELLRSSFQLKNSEAAALKNALSHDTKTCTRFRDELSGRKKSPTADRRKKQSSRRDARESLNLSRWWIVGAAAAAVLVIGITAVGVRHVQLETAESGQEDRVPNIVGMNEDEAEKLLKSLGLQMKKEKMIHDDACPAGTVSRQLTLTAARVDELEDREVRVYISLGKETAEFPKILQMEEEAARQELAEKSFSNIEIERDGDSKETYGTVTKVERVEDAKKQEESSGFLSILGNLWKKSDRENGRVRVKPGEKIPLDSRLILTVSDCQQPTEEAKTEVPDLVGKTQEEAAKLLEEMKFELVIAGNDSSDTAAKDVILSQNPKAGTKINETRVEVTISTGPETVRMVNVELLTLEEAKAKITELGLKVGTVTSDYSDSVDQDKVMKQSVDEGTDVVKKDTAVNLVVSKGPDPAEAAKQAEAERQAAAEKKEKERKAAARAEESRRAAEAARQEEAAKQAAEEASRAEESRAAEASRQAADASRQDAENGKVGVIEQGADKKGQQTSGTGTQKPEAGQQSPEAGSQSQGAQVGSRPGQDGGATDQPSNTITAPTEAPTIAPPPGNPAGATS
ncbi:MAG: PASTA domain-containing protein [Eubacteriales bacterium]|nr:PASTA domain-containing protein [Eubacteriales bacterium]